MIRGYLGTRRSPRKIGWGLPHRRPSNDIAVHLRRGFRSLRRSGRSPLRTRRVSAGRGAGPPSGATASWAAFFVIAYLSCAPGARHRKDNCVGVAGAAAPHCAPRTLRVTAARAVRPRRHLRRCGIWGPEIHASENVTSAPTGLIDIVHSGPRRHTAAAARTDLHAHFLLSRIFTVRPTTMPFSCAAPFGASGRAARQLPRVS